MIKLEKKESIYFLTMDAGENRWNTTFVREIAKALDTIEDDEGPGALITSATDSKFFSNGLDLDWIQAPEDYPDGGDREVFGEEFMYLMEMQLGLPIPRPELALFKHKIPANAFFETVQLSKRWTGTDALKAGIVQEVSSFEELSDVALIKAKELAPLANNRKNFGHQKEMLYGENAAINLTHGPAYMLKNSTDFEV